MNLFRFQTFLLTLTISVKTINTETEKNEHGTSNSNCTLNKLLEDILKNNNKISNRTNFIEESEKAKEFLNGIMNFNISNIRNNFKTNVSQKHTIIDGIIDSINMIKNNFTLSSNHEIDATKINETFIVEVNPESQESSTTGAEIKSSNKNVEVNKSINASSTFKEENRSNKTTTSKPLTYIEVLTIEPNNTGLNERPSSGHIVDILKHLMPNLKDENKNITIVEKTIAVNSTFADAKNISTIVVTYCDEKLTKANVSSGEINETISVGDKNKFVDFSDYIDDNSSMAAPHVDEVNYDEFIPEEANLTLLEQRNVLAAADYGIQMMHELFSIKEPKLYSMGLWLDDTNPARYVAAFNAPSEDSAKYFRYGYASLQAATKLQQLHNGEDVQGRTEETLFPGVSALKNSALLEQCPLRGAPKCPPASKRYRTHDGTCNNLNRPRWGSTMTPVQRFLPPAYSDGLQAPRRSVFGGKLPSPREISALVHEDRDVETASITHLLMQWGQFIDHDVTSSSQSRGFNGSVPRCCKDGGRDFVSREFMHPECLPISVPPTDRFYGPLGVRCLEFVRSSPAPKDDCSLGWREQFNQVSAYLDASPLYGSSARQSDKLRLFRNGMLQYGRVQQRRPLLPPERTRKDELCRSGAVSTDCFKSGDNRVNEHPGLVAAHIVWLRQHNRMATELAHLNPHWSDEKIYQETRKLVAAMIQHITYKEFLPIVLGSEVMRLFDLDPQKKGFYKNYNPKVNPSPASSFGSAAFRFGHSLVQSSMVRFDRHHRPIENNVSLHDELTNPSNIWSVGAVDRLLLGMVNQPIQKRDEFITAELTNHLFQTPQFPFGMDLAAINIQRGRDHGLPAYSAWREPCGLTPILDFEDLFRIMPSRAVRKLQDLYRHVDDIDLFTGGMAERPVIGGLVGPTFACIIAQQFSNLRKGDRFWYENGGFDSSFTPAQLQQIRRITLAQILCKTLDTIDNIQPFVFLAADETDNRRIPCSNGRLNNFDLSPWMEIDSAVENNVDFETNRQTDTVSKKPDEKTTKKPRPTDEKDQMTSSSNKVPVVKPAPLTMTNSTKSQNSITKRKTTVKPIVTSRPEKTDKLSDVTVQKIDDKLDFRNKSKRYENSQVEDNDNRPHKQYYDYNNDYDDDKYSEDESSVYQQAVVINNHRHQRPNKYNRPVIAVTENIDKVTYLINYVPRPSARPTSRPMSRPWRQSTRHPYDRDVVKVTYQTYEDTYKRPQQQYEYNSHSSTYYNNRLLGKPLDTNDEYRRQRPDYPTTKYADSVQSSARANDFNPRSTRATTTSQKATTKYTIPTSTEMFYRLVTFSHLGSYDRITDIDKDLIYVDTDKDKFRPIQIDTETPGLKHTDEKRKEPDSTVYSKDFTLENEKDYKQDKIPIPTNKYTTIAPPRLSTFIPSDKDLRPDFFSRPNSGPGLRLDDKLSTTDKSDITPGRFYYAANVLHRYPEIDTTLTKTDHIKSGQDNPIIKENYNNPGRPEAVNPKTTDNIEERSSIDSMTSLDDIDLESHSEQSEKGGKVRVVRPDEAPKHSVAFQVIPSENSPTTWAVYEEKSELHDSPHSMPPIHSDPHALSELPRPIDISPNNKNKRRKPQA